jgi:GH3 auxin-responsive promoter
VEASRYDLLLEPSRSGVDIRSLPLFVTAFDHALADVNVEYAAKRDSARLGLPRLHLMRPGWSERLCRQEFAQGRRDVQHKWTVLTPEWDTRSREEVLTTLDEAERPGVGA